MLVTWAAAIGDIVECIFAYISYIYTCGAKDKLGEGMYIQTYDI